MGSGPNTTLYMSARQKQLSELEKSLAVCMDFYIKWLGVSANSAVLATGLCVGQKEGRFAHELSLHTFSPKLLFTKHISKSLCLDSENEVRRFLLTSLSSWFTRTVEYMI